MTTIKRGDIVEFTDDYYQNYPPVDTSVIRYGVAIEDTSLDEPVRVKVPDGSIVVAKYIHAHSWTGWIPEGLESIVEEFESASDGWDDYD